MSSEEPRGGGGAVYNQSGVYVYVPELPEVEEESGYVSVRFIDSQVLEVVVGVRVSGLVNLTLFNVSGEAFYSYSSAADAGDLIVLNATVPSSVNIVVYKCSIAGRDLPLGAVKKPVEFVERSGLPPIPEVGVFLLALIPVAIGLSYVLSCELRRSSVLIFASLPFIYTVLSYFSPREMIPYVNIVLAVLLVTAIMYFVIGRD